ELARRLRGRAPWQPRERPALTGGDSRTLPGGSCPSRTHGRARRPAPVRSDRGARLPVSRLLRQSRARDLAARARLQSHVRGPLPERSQAPPRSSHATRRGAEADRRARARGLLPAALGRARARARMRVRSARAQLPATLTAPGTRARLFRRLARLLPHRSL